MPESAAIRIDAIEGRTVWQLKTWLAPQSETRRGILEEHSLPLRVGAISTAFGGLVLGIGPQEWLIVSDAQPATPSFASDFIAAEVSDALAVLEVQGASARELLSKGCGLDLHPRVFGVGQCARTRFAQIPVVLICIDDLHRFELYVARSYAQYLRAWLVDAASDLSVA